MKAFADLADLPEDERIRVAAEAARRGQTIGLFVDDDTAADRYTLKLRMRGITIKERTTLELKPGVRAVFLKARYEQ